MKAAELRNKTDEELREELEATLREQFNLRMQGATGQLNRNHQFRIARRKIARIKTIMNQRAQQG